MALRLNYDECYAVNCVTKSSHNVKLYVFCGHSETSISFYSFRPLEVIFSSNLSLNDHVIHTIVSKCLKRIFTHVPCNLKRANYSHDAIDKYHVFFICSLLLIQNYKKK